jgi:hypothetical protein
MLLFFFSFGVEWNRVQNWPIVPAPDDDDDDDDESGAIDETLGRRNRSTWQKPVPVPPFSTTNPKLPGTGLNPNRSGGKQKTYHLSYGTAIMLLLLSSSLVLFLNTIFIHLVRLVHTTA